MADLRDGEVPEVKAETSDTSERQKDFTRRALLQAGWVVPMVTAINIPKPPRRPGAPQRHPRRWTAFGQHHRTPDVHLDSPVPRTTTIPTTRMVTPHTDTPPHTDVPHV
jgi:hypothetical protein